MNEFETGVFNSGLVLNYLLRKKISFTLFLADGFKLTGTLLGWDADFLFVKDGNNLQMIQIKKVTRLQTDLEQIIAVDSIVKQENFTPPPVETNQIAINPPSVLSKYKPTLSEVKPAADENTDSDKKGEFKNKLDQLVKNW